MNLGLLLFFMLADFGIEKANNNCKLKRVFLSYLLITFILLLSIIREKGDEKKM